MDDRLKRSSAVAAIRQMPVTLETAAWIAGALCQRGSVRPGHKEQCLWRAGALVLLDNSRFIEQSHSARINSANEILKNLVKI